MNQEILYMKTVVNDSDLINRALIIHSFPAELTKKIPDPNNTQEYHQYYLNYFIKNIKKLVKQSKICNRQQSSYDATKYVTIYSKSKVEIIINESYTDDASKSVCTKII